MSDKLHNSMRYHIFGMVDKDNCEVLGRDIGTGIFLLRMIRYLYYLAKWHCHLLSNSNRMRKLAKDLIEVYTNDESYSLLNRMLSKKHRRIERLIIF